MSIESPSSAKKHRKLLPLTGYGGRIAAILSIAGALSSGAMAKPLTSEERLTRAQQLIEKQEVEIKTLSSEKEETESRLQAEKAINERLFKGLTNLPAEFQKRIGYTSGDVLNDETRKKILDNMLNELKDKKIISPEEYKDLQWRALKNPSLIPFIILAIIAGLSFGAFGLIGGFAGGYAGIKAAILKIKSEFVGWGKKSATDWWGNRKNNTTPPQPQRDAQQTPPQPQRGAQQTPPHQPPRGGDRQRENEPKKSPEIILHEKWLKLIQENKTVVNWKMTQEDAKKLFRRLSLKTHPDKLPQKRLEAEVIFKILNDMQPNDLPGNRGRKEYDIGNLQKLEDVLKKEGWIV